MFTSERRSTMKKKTLVISFILVLMLAMSMLLAGCGGGPANLEEYINNNEELAQEIESYSTAGMDIDISENTLTYTYKYSQVFDEATAALMTSSLEDAMSSMNSTFESVRDTLVEETGFSEIVVKIVYTDGNDTVLYEKAY